METSIKSTNITKLRSDILELASQQVVLKNQRKTVNLKGQREVDPSEASWKHQSNRWKLRRLYLTLGILRGRTIEQIEGRSKSPLTLEDISTLLKKYGE